MYTFDGEKKPFVFSGRRTMRMNINIIGQQDKCTILDGIKKRQYLILHAGVLK